MPEEKVRWRRWTNLSSLREMLTKVLPLKTLLSTDEDHTDRYSGQRTVAKFKHLEPLSPQGRRWTNVNRGV